MYKDSGDAHHHLKAVNLGLRRKECWIERMLDIIACLMKGYRSVVYLSS